MGVHGLWRLIEPSGKPVPLETLENKVLAVDISIWLHQAVKGFQDSKGASVPNAHLLGIYHRVCKLLYFRIKPIFVFDGGVPALKKQTIAKRTQSKLRNVSEADKIQKQLLSTLLKHTAVSKVLMEKIGASISSLPKVSSRSSNEEMYKLPPSSELDSTISSSEEDSDSVSTTTDSSPTKNWDLHTIDMDSVHFKSLPVDVRHEILTDLKETRKQSSWGRLHELPKVSDDFSVYQMGRLLKRQAVQAALENAEKEMGGKSLSLAELESILKDQGVITNQNVGNRIASDETTKYLLVKDLKKAIEEARQNELQSENATVVEEKEDISIIDLANENEEIVNEKSKAITTKADNEYDDDLQKAIALSLQCEPSTSDTKIVPKQTLLTSDKASQNKKSNPAEFSFLENFVDADFASSSSDEDENITEHSKSKMSSAKSYMLEYSGLTPNEIAKIVNGNPESKKLKLKKTLISIKDNNSKSITVEAKEIIKNVEDILRSSQVENTNDSVEIMSTDSSDSEVDEKINLKNVNIVINVNSEFNKEDDLFADVFKPVIPEIKVPNLNAFNLNRTDIFNEKDDLFSDVFSQNEEQVATKHKDSEVLTGLTSNAIQNPQRNHDSLSVSQKNTATGGKIYQQSSELILEANDLECMKIEDGKGEQDSKPINENKKPDQLCQAENILSPSTKESIGPAKSNEKKTNIAQKPTMTEEELKKLKDQLQKDSVDLLTEKSAKERIAGNITDQMYQEAQELLELFGVPYLIAPMEAEAQCAFLDAIEHTDGTITDDSDIWLFGGKTVYKNFFNQSKYVMEFRSENIKHHFKLTREQMILLALLVGSDYTVGLQGVGPVTAMEILAAFPPSKGKINEFSLSNLDLISGLKEFRSWFTKGKSPGPGRSSLKSKLKNLSFTENFPSLPVVQAYLDPKVETNRDAFSWGKPNAMALLEFAREKFGWTRNKTEDILNPVLKKLEESRHQKSIRNYFKTRFSVHSGEAESKMSKRVKSAITNMGRDPSEVLVEELQEELKKQPKKKRPQRKNESTEAPYFNKKRSTADSESPTRVDSEKDELKVKLKVKNGRKTRKIKDPIHESNQPSNTSQKEEVKEDVDISEKIHLIRKRRKMKEARDATEITKPKLTKEKKPSSQFLESIPDGLEADEEISLLTQIVSQSSEKVEEINKKMQEKFENMETKSIDIFKSTASPSIPIQSKPSTSSSRPVARLTRIPRKELIPQKEKDKSLLLRNKLKAIEVFRKGKQGPGFVPKADRKKRLPRAEAELSESSDE